MVPSPDDLTFMIYVAPMILLSLTLHEFAHARTALAFGDPTAKSLGRTSLNPLVHLDPIGTLCMALVGFGWAKPVPVNPLNLEPRRFGDIATSIAGPLSNVGLALLCIFGTKLYLTHYGWLLENLGEAGADVFWYNLRFGIYANLGLAIFNMLPLFPLDGHHIVREILPPDRQGDFMQWQMQYGRVALLVVIALPALLPEGSPAWASPIRYFHSFVTDTVLNWLE
jgi:Zn-dependent protease